MTVAARLRQARQAAGFRTASDAARRLAIPIGTYGGHEAGSRGVRQDDIERYAKAFGTTAAWLAFGDGEAPAKATDAPAASHAHADSDYRAAPSAPDPNRFQGSFGKVIPILGVAVGGKDEADFHLNGETVNYAPRPPGLAQARDVYALYTANDSMYPRFSSGEIFYVNPHRVPAIGDDVVIELFADTEGDAAGPGYLKRLKSRTPTKIIVEQFNPPADIEFDRDAVKLLHRVVPWQEALGL